MKQQQLLVVVRHAQSLMNDTKKLVGPFFADEEERRPVDGIPDYKIPLTEEGFRQARETGVAVRDEFGVFDCVYYSCFLRTTQTMRWFLEAYSNKERGQMKIVMDPSIHERNAGHTYNMTKAEAEKAFPWQQEYWKKYGGVFAEPPGGESLMQVVQRVRPFVDMLNRDSAGKKVLIFTHDGVLRCLRFLLENMTIEQFESLRGMENCGVTSYRYNPENGTLELKKYNEVFWK